ncbi:MAG: lamin tail domain-containing protein [Candidatus Cloacimonadota bacterium]|nr:lamin tail domain-containing protein [Candidatus Cloacimonadota bacterium]
MKNKKKLYYILALITLLILTTSVLSAQNIKINEIYYDHPSSDEGYEWIELYNAGSISINIANWRIEKAGNYFAECFTFPDISLASGDFLLIGESNVANADLTTSLAFQNAGTATDGVRIISADSDTIDTILYDSPNSNNLPGDANQPGIYFAPDVPSGYSLMRFPDGCDSDNCENDFYDCDSLTLTPGEPNVMVQDLEVVSISIFPQHPDTLDDVYFSFEIKNNSPFQIPPDSCRYEIFVNDTLFFEDVISDTINAEETVSIETFLGIFTKGLYKIAVQIFFSGDTQTTNNSITTSFLVGKAPIIINEIMFAPTSPNVEWVEIYNRSEQNFPLLNWKIRDAGVNWNSVETDKILLSQSYAVICEDSSAVKDYYGNDILLFQTNDWSALNNTTPDEVHFADTYSTQLDSACYDPSEISVPNNSSLERINPFEDGLDNWGVSVDTCGATPGRVNSITPKDYDLCASSLTKELNGNILTLSGVCTNVGFNDIEDAEAIFFNDSNFNFQLDDGEEIATQNFSISAEQSEEFSYPKVINEKNYYHFGFLIFSNFDLDTSNNIIFTTYNSPQNYPMPINEIQYAPKGDEPEWLELYNNFSYPIDILGWKLADKRDTLSLWSAKPIFLPEEYIIIVKDCADTLQILQKYSLIDSAFSVKFAIGLPTLNNDEDMLLLWDEYGTVIDSICYFSDWGEISGNSLERINTNINSNNPDNWESSINLLGATPGRENSLYIEEVNPHIKLSINPNPVSLRVKKSVLIEYNLPEVLSKVNVRIFDMKGRLIRWLSDQQWIGSQGAIIWNCKDDNGRVVPIGIYIVYLEATGKQSGKIFQKTKTMVIGEK